MSNGEFQGSGASRAGPLVIGVLGVYIALWVVVSIAMMLACWPGVDWFQVRSRQLDDEVRFLLVSIAAAGLGSTIRTLSSFAWYVGNRMLVTSWAVYYAIQPVVGTATGMFVYLAVRAGLLKANASAEALNLYTIAVLAAVAAFWAN
jgi:hypothetical protein